MDALAQANVESTVQVDCSQCCPRKSYCCTRGCMHAEDSDELSETDEKVQEVARKKSGCIIL